MVEGCLFILLGIGKNVITFDIIAYRVFCLCYIQHHYKTCLIFDLETYLKFSSVMYEQSFIWHLLPIRVYRSKLIMIVQYTEIIIDICVIGMIKGAKIG